MKISDMDIIQYTAHTLKITDYLEGHQCKFHANTLIEPFWMASSTKTKHGKRNSSNRF